MVKRVFSSTTSIMLLAAVGAIAYLLTQWQPKPVARALPASHNSINTAQQQLKPKAMPAITPAPKTVTITYDNYGFSPNIVKVPVGTTVIVVNKASDGAIVFRELTSNPSPNPELNLGMINMGQQKSFVVTKKGTWQFQNGNESSDRGVLAAE